MQFTVAAGNAFPAALLTRVRHTKSLRGQVLAATGRKPGTLRRAVLQTQVARTTFAVRTAGSSHGCHRVILRGRSCLALGR